MKFGDLYKKNLNVQNLTWLIGPRSPCLLQAALTLQKCMCCPGFSIGGPIFHSKITKTLDRASHFFLYME